MSGQRATATDVARRAGVSQSAVSRTFTPGASVSAKVRLKVLAAAQLLGYRPNALARSLLTNRSRIIAVVMSYLENQFYPEVLQALSERLKDAGYQLLLFTADAESPLEPVLDQILEFQVEGLILASVSLSSQLAKECAKIDMPVVMFNRTTQLDDVCSVTGDNLQGGRHMAAFLVAGGHTKIAFIAGLEATSTSRDRELGFVTRLNELGVSLAQRAIGNYSFEGASNAARQLFSGADRPDAVFCANDHMAIAVMDVARYEFGLRVPNDISIVGYDNVGPARWPSYAITSVEQPVAEMVDASVKMILETLEDRSIIPGHARIPGDLVIRGSARVPPGATEKNGRLVWPKTLG